MTDENAEPSAAEELKTLIAALREQAGISNAALARRLGFSQSKMNRIESLLERDRLPSLLDAGRIAWALHEVAPAPVRRHLLELALDAAEDKAAAAPLRVVLQSGLSNLQRRIRIREGAADSVATFHPAIIPGLAQTEATMRSIYQSSGKSADSPQGRRWMAARRERQQQMSDKARACTILITEGALLQPCPSAAQLVEQCDHLADLSRQYPPWRVGIIPAITPGQPEYPQNGFDLYESRRKPSVLIGTTAGLALSEDLRVVDRHRALLARLERLAVFDDEARAILARVAAQYRA